MKHSSSRARPRPAGDINRGRCKCSECAQLDIEVPGEGVQLALLDWFPRPRRAHQELSA